MASYGDWDLRERMRRVRVARAAHFTYAERPEVVWPEVDRFLAAQTR